VAGNAVLEILYGDRYQDQRWLIFLLAIFYALSYVQTILDATLRALDFTRPIFVASIVAAALTLTLGWGLTGWLSAEGAALGVILNSLVALTISIRSVRKEIA
jgi:O-antigen/teichoic acid export membrane protein